MVKSDVELREDHRSFNRIVIELLIRRARGEGINRLKIICKPTAMMLRSLSLKKALKLIFSTTGSISMSRLFYEQWRIYWGHLAMPPLLPEHKFVNKNGPF